MHDRDGKNVCGAMELNAGIQDGGEILEVNDVRSIHGQNVADIIYPIVENNVDKEKGLDYLSSASRYVQQEIRDIDGRSDITALKETAETVSSKLGVQV